MADPLRFKCEAGHSGLVLAPVERCPQCAAPVWLLSRRFAAIAADEERSAQLATVCDSVSGLADALAEIARAVHNACAVEGIAIEDLSPSLLVSPRGVMVIELLPAQEAAA